MRPKRLPCWILGWLGLATTAVANAQPSPNGLQFQVNTYTTYEQFATAVAAGVEGGFVVVWMSRGSFGSDTSGHSIQARLYDAFGVPAGPEFQVNSSTLDNQASPDVGSDPSGNFVVVWRDYGNPPITEQRGVRGRRFDATGTPLGPDFRVGSYTPFFRQYDPQVAVASDGSFVVVWYGNDSLGSDTSGASIQARRFDATGAPLGPDFQVNTYTTDWQYRPGIATDANGNFVIAWSSVGSFGSDTSDSSIQARLFDAAGTPLGPEFQVNTHTTYTQNGVGIARTPQGDFVVVWSNEGADPGPGYSGLRNTYARRFDSTGSPIGSDFDVSTQTSVDEIAATVGVDPGGNFVVAWGDNVSIVHGGPVKARRFLSDGTPLTGDFIVESLTTAFSTGFPAVAVDQNGNFVASWQSDGSGGSDSSGKSIQARRFDALFRDGFESGNVWRWTSAIP